MANRSLKTEKVSTAPALTGARLHQAVIKELLRIYDVKKVYMPVDAPEIVRIYINTQKAYGTRINCKVWFDCVAKCADRKYNDDESIRCCELLDGMVDSIVEQLKKNGRCDIAPLKVEKPKKGALHYGKGARY